MYTKCLMCRSSNNLNTRMTITIDEVSYNICLCDEHAENTTMASLRTQLAKIKKNLEDAMAAAEDAGIPIGTHSSQPPQHHDQDNTASPEPQPTQTEHVAPEHSYRIPDSPPNSVISQEHVPPVPPAPPTNTPDPSGQSSLVSEDIAEDAEDAENNKVVQMQTFTGRDGKPVNVPRHIEGDFGTTDIYITNVTDDVIQRRFKNLDECAPGQEGYSRKCPLCRGEGVSRVNNDICPKCKGTGLII